MAEEWLAGLNQLFVLFSRSKFMAEERLASKINQLNPEYAIPVKNTAVEKDAQKGKQTEIAVGVIVAITRKHDQTGIQTEVRVEHKRRSFFIKSANTKEGPQPGYKQKEKRK